LTHSHISHLRPVLFFSSKQSVDTEQCGFIGCWWTSRETKTERKKQKSVPTRSRRCNWLYRPTL